MPDLDLISQALVEEATALFGRLAAIPENDRIDVDPRHPRRPGRALPDAR